MSKAIIVVDFAYKGLKRTGRGTGAQGLKAVLKYLQYRDPNNNRMAEHGQERWHDHGLGLHHREIFQSCYDLHSPHVLAWTWVISPDPELMNLIPEAQRCPLLVELTERVVEDYYTERGFDPPEYSYVLHRANTNPEETGVSLPHLHSHIVLPGTAPTIADRLPVYNNKTRGHDRLFREIATEHFSALLDQHIGLDWRHRREMDDERPIDLDDYFR
jgi:hypothetical protein